jgi:hypothetical protein
MLSGEVEDVTTEFQRIMGGVHAEFRGVLKTWETIEHWAQG